jgi:hypothetical protein
VWHFERQCGQCPDEATALVNCQTAAIELGMLPGINCVEPSNARFGTTQEASGQQLFGILMFDNFLGDTMCSAFEKWEDAAIPVEVNTPDDMRERMKGKVWRSKCCLRNPQLNLKQLGFYLAQVHAYKLWKELEWLDAKGGALFEVANLKTGPFARALANQLNQLFTRFSHTESSFVSYQYASSPARLRRCKHILFETLVSLIASNDWKFFRPLSMPPFTLLPGCFASITDRRAICETFRATPGCDLNPLFAAKLKRLWPSADAMASDAVFWNGFKNSARKTTVTNMDIERLLALFRKSCSGKFGNITAEHIAGASYLSQWLREHIEAGGHDPRSHVRGDAERDMVATVHKRKLDAKHVTERECRGGARASFIYANSVTQDEKAIGIVRDSSDLHKRKAELYAGFKDLPLTEQERWAQKSDECKSAKLARRNSPEADDAIYHPCLWNLSDRENPLSNEQFLQTVVKNSTRPVNECSGLQSWAPELRTKFQAGLFVTDQGDIPDGHRTCREMSCPELHEGMCVGKDADLVEFCTIAGRALWQNLMDNDFERKFIEIIIANRSARGRALKGLCSVYYCAHVRGADPPVALLWPADATEKEDELVLQSEDATTKRPPVVCDATAILHLCRKAERPLRPGRCLQMRVYSTSLGVGDSALSEHQIIDYGTFDTIMSSVTGDLQAHAPPKGKPPKLLFLSNVFNTFYKLVFSILFFKLFQTFSPIFKRFSILFRFFFC